MENKQQNKTPRVCLPQIGAPAPEFTTLTTFGKRSLSDYQGSWLVFFSHPGDFTPVCTTEFIAFARAYPEFQSRNTELLGLSIDSNPSHLAWVYNIYQNTGAEIPFPIVADRDGSIARLYGMISRAESTTATVRAVFIIDPEGILRAILYYPLKVGRNIDEIIRVIDALQTADKYNVATPANWEPGDPVIVAPPTSYKELMKRVNDPRYDCTSWYLCYREVH